MNKDKWNKRNQKRLRKKANRDKSNSFKPQRRREVFYDQTDTSLLLANLMAHSAQVEEGLKKDEMHKL